MADTPAPNADLPRKHRVSSRYKARGTVECRAGVHGSGCNVARGLVNVSETGAQLLASAALELGQRVQLVLRGEYDRVPHNMLGDVIRCEPVEEGTYRLGVRFDSRLPYSVLNGSTFAK